MSGNLCTQCGASNAPQAKFCGTCGAALSPPAYNPPPPAPNYIGPGSQPPTPQSGSNNTKAVISLVLGIMSVFCCGFLSGIPGAILGKMEMDAIKQGRSPESNLGIAKAGFWISIAGSILSILWLVLILFFGLLSSLPQF